ncbi:MAG: RHS repeat-associated core domain-containing protein [Sulfurimonas sp.]
MFYRIWFITLFLFGSLFAHASTDLTRSKGTDQSVIVSMQPEPASTVTPDTPIHIEFNVDLDAKHVNDSDVNLRCISCKRKKRLLGRVTYDQVEKRVTFIPNKVLKPGIYEIAYHGLKPDRSNQKTKIKEIKYRFEVVPVVLESLTLSPSTATLEIGDIFSLNVQGSYSDGTSQTLTEDIEWIISDTDIVSVDANGLLTALHEGTATVKAQKGSVLSNALSIEIKPPVVLESISLTPNPLRLRVGQSSRVTVTGHYSNGTTEAIEAEVDLIPGNNDLISVYGDGTIEGLQAGTTTLQAKIDNFSSQNIDVIVSTALDTSNFNFTHFGSQYTDQVPADATKESYDEKRFCMIAGQIFSEDGSPLSGVKVSIHKHPEYGTAMTNSEGLYTIPAEGGLQLTMRYTKAGYTTIDRKVQAPVQDWVRAEEVTMLQEDTKVTTIDLSNSVPQAHISTSVTDERGTRSTTLVFDGARKATVTSTDGSTRVLTTFDVRATEFKTPESMPANLPGETAYTYCSDLKIDGTSDTDEITFDAPVVMYVDNFLGFEVGEIVPVGYYDRNQGQWIGSDNGAVVALLDTDNDGIVDALDSTGDGEPNDLDGDGSFSDEVVGIQNNPDYTAGKSYWRASFTHFTPWDHNWPYGPPEDADDPDVDDPKMDDDEPNDCQMNVSSYVTGKSRVFHEDIPVAGTDITLHYASNRVDGYKYSINTSVDTSTIPASVTGIKVTLSIAGRTFIKYPSIADLNDITFEWDGKDLLGKQAKGQINASVTVSYSYNVVYLNGSRSFAQAWAKVGDSTTGIEGRSQIWVSNSKTITLPINMSTISNGWSFSNHNIAAKDTIIFGNGEIESKSKLSNPQISTVVGNGTSGTAEDNMDPLETPVYNPPLCFYNNLYFSTFGGVFKLENNTVTKVVGDTNLNDDFIPSLYQPYNVVIDKNNGIMYTVAEGGIYKVYPSGETTRITGYYNYVTKFINGMKASDIGFAGGNPLGIDSEGNIYFVVTCSSCAYDSSVVYKIDTQGYVTKLLASYEDPDSLLYIPDSHNLISMAFDSNDNLYIYSYFSSKIYKINKDTTQYSVIAGNGVRGASGDGGNATDASLGNVHGLAFDSFDNLYLTDNRYNKIRVISTDGLINTIAGNGIRGFSGDGEDALKASLSSPAHITVDKNNNIYFDDSGNHRIRKISSSNVFSKYNLQLNEYLYKYPNNTADIFDAQGKHKKTIDLSTGNTLQEFRYDENKKLTTIINQFGEIITIDRDAEGNPTLITAPNGQKTYLSVDEQGNLTEIRYEDNSAYSFTYLDGSLMDIMTDPNGNRIQHIFDENGRIIEEVDGEGGSYQFLRNVTEDETFYSTVQPMGETQTSQDSTLANGDTRSLITLPTGDTITATFSKDEKTVISQKDGVSTVATYTADTLTHQKILASRETTQPGGLKQTVTYNTSYDGNETHTNSKTQTITNNGKITKILTDYNSGVEMLTSPAGRSATREYDIDTRLTSSLTSGTLIPTTFAYDSKGRVTTEATGTRETTYTYDDRGNVESITDPRGKVTTFTYDVMDRVTGVSYPDGTTEAFSYDNNGNLLTRAVPTPADHTFTYNGVDKRTGYTSPLYKATTYTYNKSKQVTQIERPSGKTITNNYDKGRLVSTSTPEGTTEYSYLFADKVGSITHGSESFSFTYDGTLLTTIAQNGLLNHTINYTYNNDFKVTSSTYAGVTENYSYDNDGLLTGSGDYTLTRDTQNGYVTQLSDGTLTQNRSYNSYGEITEVSDNTFTYQLTNRDNAGAITQKSETLNGTTTTYNYTYDDLGRLTEACRVGGTHQMCETYAYDNNGNRLSATVNGETTTASYTLDDQLEVYGDNSYKYDNDGYLIEKITPEGTTTYDYGTFGELREIVTPTQTITYKHNANNQRVAKLINGQVVEKYLWADLTTLLAIYDANDNLVQRFEYADQRMPVSMSANSTKYYLHYDQVGSLRAVSDTNGQVVKEITYDTFGNIISDSNQDFKVAFGFAGGLYDSDTGLTRFGYRDYDAYTGKWTAKDPIGFNGGDSNLYGYVLEDPVNLVDPTGENYILVGAIIVGIYIFDQVYDWFTNDFQPLIDQSDKYHESANQCEMAMQCNDPNASEICSRTNDELKKFLEQSYDTTKDSAFLPGTLGGGPVPTTPQDVVSSEIQNQLRN